MCIFCRIKNHIPNNNLEAALLLIQAKEAMEDLLRLIKAVNRPVPITLSPADLNAVRDACTCLVEDGSGIEGIARMMGDVLNAEMFINDPKSMNVADELINKVMKK